MGRKPEQPYGSPVERLVAEIVWLAPAEQPDNKAGAQRTARKILRSLAERGYLSDAGLSALFKSEQK